MNYEMLDKILEKNEFNPKKIWKFFGVENKEAMELLIESNFKDLKIEVDDTFIYISLETMFESIDNPDPNTFFENMMIISFFLKGFAKYEDSVTKAFIESVGAINFILIFEKVLGENPYYQFFKKAFKEYKQDRYIRNQTDKLLAVFNEIFEQFQTLDLASTKAVLEEIKLANEK